MYGYGCFWNWGIPPKNKYLNIFAWSWGSRVPYFQINYIEQCVSKSYEFMIWIHKQQLSTERQDFIGILCHCCCGKTEKCFRTCQTTFWVFEYLSDREDPQTSQSIKKGLVSVLVGKCPNITIHHPTWGYNQILVQNSQKGSKRDIYQPLNTRGRFPCLSFVVVSAKGDLMKSFPRLVQNWHSRSVMVI